MANFCTNNPAAISAVRTRPKFIINANTYWCKVVHRGEVIVGHYGLLYESESGIRTVTKVADGNFTFDPPHGVDEVSFIVYGSAGAGGGGGGGEQGEFRDDGNGGVGGGGGAIAASAYQFPAHGVPNIFGPETILLGRHTNGGAGGAGGNSGNSHGVPGAQGEGSNSAPYPVDISSSFLGSTSFAGIGGLGGPEGWTNIMPNWGGGNGSNGTDNTQNGQAGGAGGIANHASEGLPGSNGGTGAPAAG